MLAPMSRFLNRFSPKDFGEKPDSVSASEHLRSDANWLKNRRIA
jgi:hypothetical protein